MVKEQIPFWMQNLKEDEWQFINDFIKTSGSLKKMAEIYQVSYPTMRLRLDKLIMKISSEELHEKDNYIQTVQQFVVEKKVSAEVASVLLEKYLLALQKQEV